MFRLLSSPMAVIKLDGTLTVITPLAISELETACITVLSMPGLATPQVNITTSPTFALAGKGTRTLTSFMAFDWLSMLYLSV